MKSYRIAALLALSLSATLAHAARDDTVLQQTRKNQRTHDAQAGEASQPLAGQHAQEKDSASAAAASQPQQAQSQSQAQRQHS